MSVRKFGPKSEGHPSIGMECPRCLKKFMKGDFTTLVGDEPAGVEDAEEKRAGRAYTVVASEIHWDCVTAQD